MIDLEKTNPSKIKTFFSNRLVKIIGVSLATTLGVAVVGGASYGIYYAITSSNQQQNIAPFDWSNFSPEWKTFSTSNSYRVQLVTSEQNNTVNISGGTAWSWYQHKDIANGSFNWYLMTNFHVVNSALYFNDGNSNGFKDKKNIPISKGFALQTFDHNSMRYQDVATKNKRWGDENKLENQAIANYKPSKVEVIFDYSQNHNVNDNLVLFSNSSTSLSDDTRYYNLDMALVKISYNWNDYLQFSNYFNQIGNPYDLYLNNTHYELSEESIETYLAGNPFKSSQIVASKFESDFYVFNGRLKVDDTTYPDSLLKELKAPYFYSHTGYNNWKLGPGASGSATYQGKNVGFNTSPIDLLPTGIYWGVSLEINSNKSYPSFIPLIYKPSNLPNSGSNNTFANSLIYNIYENFKTFLSSQYVNS